VQVVDKKHGIVNMVFLAEFSKERMSDCLVCRWLKRCLWYFVCFGIDSSIQPVLLVVEADHSFVDRNAIRTPTSFGL